MPICKVCKKQYDYNNEVGYSRELCGPYCDGLEKGKAETKALREEMEQFEISLPVITDKLLENHSGMLKLIRRKGDNYEWTQDAVDFACMLKEQALSNSEDK